MPSAFGCALLLAALPWSEPATGLIVEQVQAGYAADKGGLRPGDVLLAWRRAPSPPANPEPAGGEFRRAFETLAVEQEEAPRGPFEVTVLRGAERLSLTIPPGMWLLSVRPALAAPDLEKYEQARALAAAEPQRAFALASDLARTWRASGDRARAAWLLYTLARGAVEKRVWPAADAAFREALDVAREDGDHVAAGFVLTFHGRSLETRGQLEAAQARHEEALAEYRAAGRSALLEAWGLGQLARVAFDRGELDAAEAHDHATLAVRERLAPDSTAVAASLMELALVAEVRGDLVAGEEYDRRALRLLEALPPGPTDLGVLLNNLASTLYARGDLAAAEEYLLRAVALMETVAPGSVTFALGLSNLGRIASARGDLETAERYQRRALEIQEKRTPDGHWVAGTLRNIGEVAVKRGDLAAAHAAYSRSVEIFERWAPGAFDVALSLLALGEVTRQRGDLAGAEAHVRRAQSVIEKLGLKGLELSACLSALGELARARGDLAAAESHLRQALAIRHELAPGSAEEAETLHELALLASQRGSPEQALEMYARALDALERQRARLGGSDQAKARFGASYAAYYREALDLLIASGRSAEAFQVLERFRARSFLSLLAERELVFASDVPPELDRERRMANVEYDRALTGLMDGKAADLEARRQALGEVRQRQSEIQARIRAASPHLATLQYPEPFDLAATREALDAGTLLLSYSIGDTQSYLFAVGPGPADFRVLPLDTDRKRLREEVGRFRQLLQQENRLQRGAIESAARKLSNTLLSPAAAAIRRAERLLVVPDGALHLVPFAALADPLATGRQRYLVEAKPVHVAASATVFGELKKSRRERGPARLVAFGDPDYAAAEAAGRPPDRPIEEATRRGLELVPLPSARREVREVASLFPQAQVYLGALATEERAKTVGERASLIHFACHGLADEDAPLDSALALALPGPAATGRDNGLLQAWEIFEQVRLDADLVTLSACGTGLGKELSGEGLLGLTRAFQYAGARTVLASLWNVGDQSTAELMRRFYGQLSLGRSKDAALRAAQLELLRHPASSHPHRWAAFQLVGDWR